MTEQECAELEQAAKPQRWGSKERVALVAEVLRQKRMVEFLVRHVSKNMIECPPPDKFRSDEECEEIGCEACWMQWVEQTVAEEISPKG